MRKTDKKLDNTLRVSLTRVCETALEEVAGFKWLTHLVNFSDFSESLRVVCVFESDTELNNAKSNNQDKHLRDLIKQELETAGIKLKNISKQISFDTEEQCELQNNGRWSNRLQ